MSTPEETRLVRLVGYQPKKGYVLQRLMVHRKLYRNQAPEGMGPGKWYEVPFDIAESLADETQPTSDLRAFDVCTAEQAERMDAKVDIEDHRPSRRPQKLKFDDVPDRDPPDPAPPRQEPPTNLDDPDNVADEGSGEVDAVAQDPIPTAAARGRRRRATRPAAPTE